MEGRDALNRKIFTSKVKGIIEEAKAGDEKIEEFLKVLQKLLVKEAGDKLKASKVTLTGSYLVNTCVKANLRADLYVTVPVSLCSADDVKKHGWIHSRNKYLTDLCKFLRGHQLVAEVEDLADNFNKKVVTVKGPKTEDPNSEGWVVYIHAGIELSPSCTEYLKQPVTIRRSPFYSQLVLEDFMTGSLYQSLHASFGANPTLSPVSVLLKLWAAKQGLTDIPDGLTDNVIHCILMHLANVGMVSDASSLDQAFRVALQFISEMPAFINVTPTSDSVMAADHVSDTTIARHNELKEEHPQVLVYDGLNVWYNSTEHAVSEIKMMAKSAISVLNTFNANDAIESLFRIPTPFWLKFDLFAVLPYPESLPRDATAKHDASFTTTKDYLKLLHTNLKYALGDELSRSRCKTIDGRAVFGIGLYSSDSLSVNEYIIKGPPLVINHERNTEAISTFDALWGPRSKTCQFADNVVRKAAAFTEAKSDHEYVQLMLQTLLRNLKLKEEIRMLGKGAEHCLEVETEDGLRFDPMQASRYRVTGSLTQLTEYLRNLDDFPLQIISVDGAHPALRNAAVAPPTPHSSLLRVTDEQVPEHLIGYADGVEAMEVVIGFSRTSAWPDHKDAVDNIKVSIYCRIAARLRKERRVVCIPRRDCVDVLLNGYVFRLYAYHPKEVTLLRSLGMEGVAQALHKQLYLLPLHNDMVAAYAGAFAAFSPGVRMLKRWASAHYMSSYVTEEALELIMCKVYSYSYPPRTGLTAFTRALHLIASWSWDSLAMAVPPLSGDTSNVGRKRGQGPAMWFNTTYDSHTTCFSSATPNVSLLRRFVGLAKATLLSYFSQMQDFASPETWDGKWKALYTTSLKPFDLVITLNKEVIKNAQYAFTGKKTFDKDAHPKGFLFRPGCETRREELHKMINYDPVDWYISQLRKNFREFAMFAYDKYGGGHVAVVGLQQFTSEEANKLAEFFNGMGEGIVKRVQVSDAFQPTPEPASKKRKASVAQSKPPAKKTKAAEAEQAAEKESPKATQQQPHKRTVKKKIIKKKKV